MKSALLVIDVQQGLFNPPPAEAEQVLTRINQLSEHARQAGVPVIFIQHQTAHEELSAGSAAWQIHQGLQVKPGIIGLIKPRQTPFYVPIWASC